MLVYNYDPREDIDDFNDDPMEDIDDFNADNIKCSRHKAKVILKKKWKTKEGEFLLISEMKTSHIKNCLKMLRRNNYIGVKEMAEIMSVDSDDMGDMAQLAFEQAFDDALEKMPTIAIDYFIEELDKRGESE